MVDLNSVCWKKDRITERFVREHEALLRRPSKMNPRELAGACTYCETIENPYAEALTKRAGNAEAFRNATNTKDKRKALDNAAKAFGIRLI